MEELIQFIIMLTGMGSIYCVNHPNTEVVKYASIIGLIGQPFWFYSSATNGQWGVFLLTAVYTACWIRGFFRLWINNYQMNE